MIRDRIMNHHLESIIGLMLMVSQLAYSQNVELRIDTLRIAKINNVDTEEITFHEDGPVVKMKVSIHNDEKSSILIHPSEARYFLTFNVDNKRYDKELFPLTFMDSKEINLEPKQTIEFRVADNLFYGTSIFSSEKTDYSKDLLKALPTLKFKYKESNLLLETSRIGTVELNEN